MIFSLSRSAFQNPTLPVPFRHNRPRMLGYLVRAREQSNYTHTTTQQTLQRQSDPSIHLPESSHQNPHPVGTAPTTDVFDPELDGTELIYYCEITSRRDYSPFGSLRKGRRVKAGI
jgi:hypothetical protein